MADDIGLSPEALAALQQFYTEQALEKQLPVQEKPFHKQFPEDWNLSQFWYTPETAQTFAEEAKKVAAGGPIACISSPSVFNALLEHPNAFLFEYDRRFSYFGDRFTYYDYNEPSNVPKKFERYFDIIVMDPPHLSKECMEKVIETANLLSKSDNTPWIICTGSIVEPVLLQSGRKFFLCDFKPQHIRQLLNPFSAYLNYKSDLLPGHPI
eukprot:TRINITY_DN5260_c0_g1_i1.p1 TRINITY_DN5260_c0_g1~~TRINITY_DN5260_c0_g1_i1.p1  ORF type:complete len:210 (-),score=38.72 TRINITY_DN5260_c0_g1_i1:191-820(-)